MPLVIIQWIARGIPLVIISNREGTKPGLLTIQKKYWWLYRTQVVFQLKARENQDKWTRWDKYQNIRQLVEFGQLSVINDKLCNIVATLIAW